ncbi:MAG: glycosyltransferase family 2 protein [Bdellovibrionota bacterium]
METNQNLDESSPEISLIIPAYNEAARITPTLESYCRYLNQHYSKYELIVVNDGSTDLTSEIVKSFSLKEPAVSVLDLGENRGKGFAVQSGMLVSKGKKLLFADADGASPIEELARLENALELGADVVIGSRAKKSEDTEIKTALHRILIGRIFNGLVNLLAVPGIKDTQCGFKLFTRKAADFIFSRQRSTGFSFDVELLLIAQKSGMTISEVPINWVNVPGSKVNLVTDSLRMFRDIIRFRFWHHALDADSFECFKN